MVAEEATVEPATEATEPAIEAKSEPVREEAAPELTVTQDVSEPVVEETVAEENISAQSDPVIEETLSDEAALEISETSTEAVQTEPIEIVQVVEVEKSGNFYF